MYHIFPTQIFILLSSSSYYLSSDDDEMKPLWRNLSRFREKPLSCKGGGVEGACGMEKLDCAKHKQFIFMIATLCLSHFLLHSSFPSLEEEEVERESEHMRKREYKISPSWISCYIVKYGIKKKRDHFCGIWEELKWDGKWESSLRE